MIEDAPRLCNETTCSWNLLTVKNKVINEEHISKLFNATI